MARFVITGTSRGIGHQLVKRCSGEGHEVLALSRNENPISQLKLPGVTAWAFDITNPDHLQKVAEWVKENWGKADILIHNAGMLLNQPFEATGISDFTSVYKVNVFGVAELTRVLLPLLNPSGHVVVVSSMGGVQGSAKFPGLAAYSSSKGAVITLTELLAEEYKERGPSFNALALGAVQTEMLEAAFPGYQAPVSASEMAEFMLDFALNGHRYFNGKVLPVSSSTP